MMMMMMMWSFRERTSLFKPHGTAIAQWDWGKWNWYLGGNIYILLSYCNFICKYWTHVYWF